MSAPARKEVPFTRAKAYRLRLFVLCGCSQMNNGVFNLWFKLRNKWKKTILTKFRMLVCHKHLQGQHCRSTKVARQSMFLHNLRVCVYTLSRDVFRFIGLGEVVNSEWRPYFGTGNRFSRVLPSVYLQFEPEFDRSAIIRDPDLPIERSTSVHRDFKRASPKWGWRKTIA